MGNDIRRWVALLADGVSAHDGDVPLDGSVARGVRDDERRQHPAGCVADYTETFLAGRVRHVAHPVRACDRVLRSSGPAWPAGWDTGIHFRHLSGYPSLSQRGGPGIVVRSDLASDHV